MLKLALSTIKQAHYFDLFKGQRIWYDAEIMLTDLKTSQLVLLALKLVTSTSCFIYLDRQKLLM
jgi:hypothetical protein